MTLESKVTVAIPTYNRSQLLKTALQSVLAQDYPDFRVVVIDDASSDDTEKVVRSFADPRVTFIRNDINIGQLRSCNRALEVNSSSYLNILRDDDVMLSSFIRESVVMLDEHPEVAFSFTTAKYVDINRLPLGVQYTQDMPAGVTERLKFLELHVSGHQCTIEPSTVMMRSAAVANVGPFDGPHGRYTFDLNLWFRLAARFSIAFIPRELVEVRIHTGQASEVFRQGGYGRYEVAAEQIAAISYLFQSTRAEDPLYREWLARRLRTLHFNQSLQLQTLMPKFYLSWTERLEMTKEDLVKIIPPGSSFILVDNDELGIRALDDDRVAIPFIEKAGVYWGPPADESGAIEEFERLRQSSPTFLVFAWPAFWWLDHYRRLHEYLEFKFRRVFENSRLIAFDLRL